MANKSTKSLAYFLCALYINMILLFIMIRISWLQYMKVYYFLSNLSQEDHQFFLDKVSMIHSVEDVDTVIDAYAYKIWIDNTGRTYRAAFIEACMFIKSFLWEYKGIISDIHWVYKENFLSFNREVHIYFHWKWEKIERDTLFITSRDSWRHPFFYYLHNDGFDSHIYATKPNMRTDWWYYDKLFFIHKLWKLRKDYIGDIIIPFFMDINEESIWSLLWFVYEKLGKQFVVKNNFWVEWTAVKAIDYSKINIHDEIDYITKKFFSGKNIYWFHAPYFSPYYDIKKEFRVYYTFSNDTVSIYSVKNKSFATQDADNIFAVENLSRDNLRINWSYCSIKDFEENYMEAKYVAEKMIRHIGLEIWVLEFCQLRDNTYRFIELNHLGGTLMFPGADEQWMKDYYADMWSQNFQRCPLK